MKTIYVHQNYRKSYSGLGDTYLYYFKQNAKIEVTEFRFMPITHFRDVNRLLNRLRLLRNWHFQNENQRLLNLVRFLKPNHIFVMKGTDLYPSTLQTIRRSYPEILLSCFNPDDPYNLNEASSRESILQSMKYYNNYFIWSKQLVNKISLTGVHVHFLTFGVDKRLFYKIPNLAFKYDITFIGNGDVERNRWIRDIGRSLQNQDKSISFYVFGKNINEFEGVEQGGQKNGMDYLKVLTQSRINVNLLREQNRNSTNMRTFEIPACGAFMMHQTSNEAREIFIENEEAVYFDTVDDLVEKACYYLNNDMDREIIAKRGYKKALEEQNQYTYRVKEILSKVQC